MFTITAEHYERVGEAIMCILRRSSDYDDRCEGDLWIELKRSGALAEIPKQSRQRVFRGAIERLIDLKLVKVRSPGGHDFFSVVDLLTMLARQ